MATAFKQVVHQNLECPICLGFFKEPKILTCSHTFCRGCLETLLESNPDEEKLSCPVCREDTSVPNRDMSRLQTSMALRSLIADLETQGQVCANCDPEDKTFAVVYCKDCSKYLCETCRSMHCKWVEFSDHSVVAASDVTSSKVSLRRRCKCQKHPTDDEECFCSDCGKYVCFKCGVLEHAQEGHKIMEAALHENEQKKVIEELVSRAEEKVCDVEKHVALVVEQRVRLRKGRERLCDEVDESFVEAVRRLTVRKEVLKSEVGEEMEALETMLVGTEETGRQQIVQINAVCGLVKNGLKIPLQKEALTAHNTLCQGLEELLCTIKHDDELPRRIADEGDQLHFMGSQGSDGPQLGQIRRRNPKWILHSENQLPGSMNGMAISPSNVLAIGCLNGKIFTCSADGSNLENVSTNLKIRALQFISNGWYVVRDYDNNISMYTPRCEKKLDVKFETLSNSKGGPGDLTLNKDGPILSCYRTAEKFQVHKQEGGIAVREISCGGLEPYQIFAMTSSKNIVVKSGAYTVHVIDGLSGATIHKISKDQERPYPAVCKDDSVIIAWVKHNQGHVSIDQYTRELKHIKNILTDFRITKSSRDWYYLQQFNTGEIAFCTPDRLYIFRETWT